MKIHSFLHPEDRRELCRASAECLIAKDPPLHITTILRFYERPGKTSLKIVTLYPLKPPLHGVATRIEPYPPPPPSRGAAAGWKQSLTEVPSGSGQGKRPAPLAAPARGHPLPSTTAAPAPAPPTGLAADFSTPERREDLAQTRPLGELGLAMAALAPLGGGNAEKVVPQL